ncbi:hypothetical protein H5410_006758 [Solanum commersonii]|uniref:Uncharacterized protein n=1 Tax=Solanum commersonii TaxID=4109 RepID=A0A9J6AB51_SOLCO|nr:hypothetical protein H5410_006758 [Solanum commersonii]
MKDAHPIFSTFKSEETCIERYLYLSSIYLEVKNVHPIYSTFKSEKTWVERYLHISLIYSEVKDVHPIYSTFKSEETCVERYLHLSRIYSEVKDVHPICSAFKSEETCNVFGRHHPESSEAPAKQQTPTPIFSFPFAISSKLLCKSKPTATKQQHNSKPNTPISFFSIFSAKPRRNTTHQIKQQPKTHTQNRPPNHQKHNQKAVENNHQTTPNPPKTPRVHHFQNPLFFSIFRQPNNPDQPLQPDLTTPSFLSPYQLTTPTLASYELHRRSNTEAKQHQFPSPLFFHDFFLYFASIPLSGVALSPVT